MYNSWFTSIIIPARNEKDYIEDVINGIPEWIDLILVADDGSTDSTGEIAKKALVKTGRKNFDSRNNGPWSTILKLKGEGVGKAIMQGYEYILTSKNTKHIEAYTEKKSVCIVMAGDGQMDHSDLKQLLDPIVSKEARYTKGNRFNDFEQIGNMPMIRRIGSNLLSVLTTLSSGISVRDPQCGYTALELSVLEDINFENPWKGYGYPNWLLLKFGINNIPVKEVNTKCIYKGEKSGIKLWKFFPTVAAMLFLGLWKRGADWYVFGKGIHKAKWYIRVCLIFSWISAWSSILLLVIQQLFQMMNIEKNILIIQFILSILICYTFDKIEINRRFNA